MKDVQKKSRFGLKYSLQAKFILLALSLSLIPLLVVSLTLLGTSYNARRKDILNRQQDEAQHLAQGVETAIGEVQQALDVVGQTSNWEFLDPSDRRLLVDTLYAYRTLATVGSGFSVFDEILLLDKNGVPVAGHSSTRMMSLEAWADEVRTVALDTVMQGEVYRGAVYISPGAVPTMDLAVPARDLPGRITGLLWGGVDLDKTLWPIITAPGLTEGSLVYVVDDEGYLIARSDSHGAVRDEKLNWLPPVQKTKEGFWRGTETYQGMLEEEVVGVWQPVGELGWTVIVELPTAVILGDVFRLLMPAVVLSFVTIIVAVGAGFLVSRFLTRPVELLRAGAEVIGAGNLEHRLEVRSQDEIGRLAQTFNQMADSLQASRVEIEQWGRELESKVQQRTAELERLTRNLEDAVGQSRRRAQRLEASSQVAHAVASVLDPDELLSQVVELIADRVGFYHAGIFLLDEAGQYAVLRAANSAGGQRMLARGHRLQVGQQGIVGYVTGTGRPHIALDVGADAAHFDNPDLPQTRSEMALPLRARGRIIGALDIQSLESEAFDDEDVTVLQTLADQIALALDNARLFEESQNTLREMQRVQAQYTIQAWRGYQAEQQLDTIEYTRAGVEPLGDQLLQEVKRATAGGESLVSGGDDRAPATLVVPLKLHGQSIGVLGFQETEPGRVWTSDEVALAEAIADELAQVLESARLFEDAQQRAWREQSAGQIAAQIRTGTDVQDILQTAAQELGRALGVSRAIVRLGSQEASIQDPEEALS